MDEKNPKADERLTSIEPHGILFGRQFNEYVMKPETMVGHVMIMGRPDSGKSSCVVIPTLRHWKGSIFAIDIKGELYTETHAYRKNVKVLDIQDKTSHYCYDPYFFIKSSEDPVQEAYAIAEALIPMPPDAKEPFWIKSAQTIMTGAILHYYSLGYSFIETLEKIQKQSPLTLVEIIAASSNKKASLLCRNFADIGFMPLTNIFAEISNRIAPIVTDDNIVRVLTQNGKQSISPEDLETGQDIFIKIPEHLIRQCKDFFMLIMNQFITFFERHEEKDYDIPILVMLDEFPRLGKIPRITDVLATLPKKITICLCIQSLAQLDAIYNHSQRKVIMDLCAFKAVFNVTDTETQEYLAKLVGTYEIKSRWFAPAFAHKIKPEEFSNLQDIILLHPFPPNFCRVKKQPYYLPVKDE